MFHKEGTRTSLGLSLTTIYLLTPEKKKKCTGAYRGIKRPTLRLT
jgi:hypothetical protein